MKTNILIATLIAGSGITLAADRVAWIPMTLDNSGNITEMVSGSKLAVSAQRPAFNMPGAAAEALRFDGYTTRVAAPLSELAPAGNASYTVSIWLAPQTYPMMSNDIPSQEKALIAGTYDDDAKTGFGFFLGREGDLDFRYFSGGWPGTLTASKKLPLEEWTRLTAVVDGTEKKVRLYYGEEMVGETKCMNSNPLPAGTLKLGADNTNGFMINCFRIDTFNGLMDDLEVYAEAVAPADLNQYAENDADMNTPGEWWDDQPLRPMYHAMPAMNWMNESHGLTYSDGKYHLFFQKNGNGPYMSRLHWGHVVSSDLCNWEEEKIAIVPGENYDIKGCWSGTIYCDEDLTGGMPRAYYTGVDYAKARIVEANPVSADLKEWTKTGVVIDGRPSGLTDDFRDCFVFRNGSDYYMIVGSSKEGKGVATLHKLDRASGRWSNDGKLFWEAPSASVGGSFWEMPNVTKIGDKWIFTVTPQGLPQGVQCIYWVGDINSDGTFSPITPANTPGSVELNGTSRDGYGLLSPSIYQNGSRTLAMGIVPDKLAGIDNHTLGWAHNISLPREWSLDSENRLIQKPAAELMSMRTAEPAYQAADLTLVGSQNLGVASNRCEVVMTFKKGNAKTGLKFFRNGDKECRLVYDPAANQVSVNMANLDRLNNDSWSYNGVYTGTLPEVLPAGAEMKLQVFVDGSIMDIFVNDKWAFSVRVFPTSGNLADVEAFSDGTTNVKSLQAWGLTKNPSSVNEIFGFGEEEGLSAVKVMGGVKVNGVEPGLAVSLHTPAGVKVGQALAGASTVIVPTDTTGLVIVSAPGKKSCKILL